MTAVAAPVDALKNIRTLSNRKSVLEGNGNLRILLAEEESPPDIGWTLNEDVDTPANRCIKNETFEGSAIVLVYSCKQKKIRAYE